MLIKIILYGLAFLGLRTLINRILFGPPYLHRSNNSDPSLSKSCEFKPAPAKSKIKHPESTDVDFRKIS